MQDQEFRFYQEASITLFLNIQCAWYLSARGRLIFQASCVGRVDRLRSGENCGAGETRSRSFRAAHSGAAPSAVSAAVQQYLPGQRSRQSGHFAKHDLDDVADGIARIFGPPRTLEPTIHKQLQQIES